MIKNLAKLTSNILNPFLVSFAVMVLLAFEATSSSSEALKWALISLALSVLPVFAVVVYLVRTKKLDGIFINPREQRTRIYLMAIILAIISCAVLYYIDSPELLMATFVAGLTAIAVFMLVNLFWKISLHTAFVAGSVTILIILYSVTGIWAVLLLPLIAWARIQMKLHSPAQAASGMLVSACIVVIVFQLFGLIW